LYRSITLSTLAIAVFSGALWNSREPIRPPGLSKNAAPLNWVQELSKIAPPEFDGQLHATITEEAAEQFKATMAFYKRGACQMAIPGLMETLELDSRAIDARFYLGICLVMSGETEQGELVLEDTVAWGNTVFREPALVYGAHANLKLYRVARAHAMLLDAGESLSDMLAEP